MSDPVFETCMVLEKALKEERAKVLKLRKALDDAAAAVTSEYCSHRGECGAENNSCYSQDFYKVLKETEP